MADKSKIFSGARAILSVGNDTIGLASGVSGGEVIDVVPIVVLNNVQTVEHVPVGYTVSFSASQVVFAGGRFKDRNLFPLTDGNPVTHLQNLLSVGGGPSGLTVTIFDSAAGGLGLYMRCENAQMVSKSWAFGPRDVVAENVDFVATRMFEQGDDFDLP